MLLLIGFEQLELWIPDASIRCFIKEILVGCILHPICCLKRGGFTSTAPPQHFVMHCHCIFIFRGAAKPENRNAVSNDPTFNFLVHKKSNSSVIVHLFNQCFYTLSIKHVSFHQENCHSSLHKQCVAAYKLRVEVSSLS